MAPVTLAENAPEQTTVATVSASNNGGAVTYSLHESSPNIFAIDSLSGVITLTAGLNYETDQQYSITVVATDPAGNSGLSNLIVNIIDIEYIPPVITSLSTGTLTSPVPAANVTNAIYTITADDPDNTSSELTYSISNNPGSIRVDEDTGEIFLNASPGYPVTFDMDEITFDATVTDDTGLFDTEAITIEILTADTGGWG